MSTEDAGYKKFFDEMIASPASPELNLLSDEIEAVETADQSDVIPTYHPPLFPLAHPILHRLQPLGAPPVNMIKAHVLSQAPVVSQTTVGGGISPTLTWSGGPSPIEKVTSPTFQDYDDFVHIKAEPEIDHWSSSLFSEGSLVPNPSGTATRKTRRDSSATSVSSVKRSSRNNSRHSRSRSAQHDSGAEDEDLSLSVVSGSTRVDPDSPPLGSASLAVAATSAASPPPRKRARATTFSGSTRSEDSSRLSSTGVAHRVVPTGHRRNLTSANLVPLDAPTQIRNYLTPSSTSKKEIPSAFVARRNKLKMKETIVKTHHGRKRSRDEVEQELVDSVKNEDEDQLGGSQDETLDQETTSLLSAIEAKRRQNTLAARRSRQRKLDYVRNLEELLAMMTRERDDWKERAEKAEFELAQRVDD